MKFLSIVLALFTFCSFATPPPQPKIDILWVIDNSGSMGYHQDALDLLPSVLLNEFGKSMMKDWRMGVISTDIAYPPTIGFTDTDRLGAGTTFAEEKFQKAIRKLGFAGSVTEFFFKPVIQALEKNTFLRDGAELAIIYITDEPGSTDPADRHLDLLAYLHQVNSLATTRTFGMIGSEDDCAKGLSLYKGSALEAFFKLTKGQTYSLCAPGIENNIRTIAMEIGKFW